MNDFILFQIVAQLWSIRFRYTSEDTNLQYHRLIGYLDALFDAGVIDGSAFVLLCGLATNAFIFSGEPLGNPVVAA